MSERPKMPPNDHLASFIGLLCVIIILVAGSGVALAVLAHGIRLFREIAS